jgi:hypothetical protein
VASSAPCHSGRGGRRRLLLFLPPETVFWAGLAPRPSCWAGLVGCGQVMPLLSFFLFCFVFFFFYFLFWINLILTICFAGFILGTLLEQIYDSNYILNIQQGVLICACAHGITYVVLGF